MITVEKKEVIRRVDYYFPDALKNYTDKVLEAVEKRLQETGLKHVVIASTSGETALKFAKKLKDKVKIICVSEAPYRLELGERWPCLTHERKKELERLGVTVIDRSPYIFHSSIVEASRWNIVPPEKIFRETLYCFGQGMKVAVEVILTAVSCGYLKPYIDVIGVGGSGKGADTAIIARSTFPQLIFSEDKGKRLEIKEIIAMPRKKKWWE